jgi:DNA repair exonuclease SbcCD ATPase subunit
MATIRRLVAKGDLDNHESGNMLSIRLSKSPCPVCGPALTQFTTDLKVSLSLEVIALYMGRDKDAEGRTRTVKEREAEAIPVLEELRKAGVQLSVLAVEQIIEKHYTGVDLDEREKEAIRERTRRLQPIIDKINDDARKLETKVTA